MQTTVITEKQARQITGGRKPLVPVEYEQAVAALQQCVDLDEAKYWENKADALAAWARIYRDDEVGLKAKKLKLHAYRRMSQLAMELRPGGPAVRKGAQGCAGHLPGPRSLLIEHGVGPQKATDMMRIGRMPEGKFQEAVRQARPVRFVSTDSRGLRGNYRTSSEGWIWLTRHETSDGLRLGRVRDRMLKRRAKDVAAQISPGEVKAARTLVQQIQEWLDEFEQYLPKEN